MELLVASKDLGVLGAAPKTSTACLAPVSTSISDPLENVAFDFRRYLIAGCDSICQIPHEIRKVVSQWQVLFVCFAGFAVLGLTRLSLDSVVNLVSPT